MRRTTLTMLLLASHALVAAPTAKAQTTALPGDAPSVKVGDTWRWVRSDRRTGLKEAENTRTIKAVAADRIDADESDGPAVYTKDMHAVETALWSRTPPPPFYAWPLAVGKKWDFKYAQANKTGNLAKSRWEYSAEVVGQERVKVAAGEFDTFKITYKGYWNSATSSASGRAVQTIWYAPAARAGVKCEFEAGTAYNVTELVELKLQP
jgi:hypothetical protein